MATEQDRHVGGHDFDPHHNILSKQERERIFRPYLPRPPKANVNAQTKSKPVRGFVKNQFHLAVYTGIHLFFSLYMILRQTYHIVFDRVLAVLYYHHRAPELIKQDVKGLDRVPGHLSVILELKGGDGGQASLQTLMDEVAEIAAWSTCVGVPMLSVYEKTGVLKHYILVLHRAISAKMYSYLGRGGPSLQIGAPNVSSYLNGTSSEASETPPPSSHLSILLLSSEDGRATLVDLTKTLAEMSQRKKLAPNDITQDLVDAEIAESVMGEPDLLILFGPNVQLQGYPPWQVRLSEIYHVQDNSGVGYQVFLRALHSYAKAQMKFGR